MKKSIMTAFPIIVLALSGCSLDEKSKLKEAAECDRTELRDGGNSIVGEYPKWDIKGLICVMDTVEMPDWTKSDLQSTRSLDGRKTAEWGDLVASWSFDGDDISMTVRVK